MIRAAIATGNEIYCEGLKSIVKGSDTIQLSGWAHNWSKLMELALSQHPDILLLDYSTGDMGVNKIKDIRALFPATKLLAITKALPKNTIQLSLKNGIRSHLLDNCGKDEIIEAIEATVEGKQFYCGQVIDIISDGGGKGCEGVSISSRETEIIKMIAEGLTHKEIAEKLFLSNHTVNTHRKNIMQKLGLKNVAGIVIYAVKENIVNAELH